MIAAVRFTSLLHITISYSSFLVGGEQYEAKLTAMVAKAKLHRTSCCNHSSQVVAKTTALTIAFFHPTKNA